MAQRDRRSTVRVDSDGVRTETEPSVRVGIWLLVAAVAGLAIAVAFLRRPAPAPPAEVAGEAASGARHDDPVQRAEAPVRRAQDAAPAQPARRVARPVPRAAPIEAPAPAARADPDAAPEASDETVGEPSGIALFPPPGTDPPKPGIIVPEDFELPPGYVRHYQATDDGQRLPAILMFHPDYEWVDERGAPLALPADGVVPPDLAPPGLPITILEVPETDIPQIEEPPGS
jgi:hypothetical protein